MDRYKKLLASFIEVVTFLLAAFSGFLKNVAPPDATGASYDVGILSFLLLIVLLTISAMSRLARRPMGRKWLVAGVVCFVLALPAAYGYPKILRAHTYAPKFDAKTRHVKASSEYLTKPAKQFADEHPTESSAADLEQNFAYDDIWTKEGLELAEQKLLLGYAWLVLALCTAIFCLVEANVADKPTTEG